MDPLYELIFLVASILALSKGLSSSFDGKTFFIALASKDFFMFKNGDELWKLIDFVRLRSSY